MKKRILVIIISFLTVLALIGGHYFLNISFTEKGPAEVKITKQYDDFKSPFIMPEFEYGWYHDDVTNTKLPYRYSLPMNFDKNKKYPVILFFHGSGSVGSDNRSQVGGITNAFPVAGDIVSQAILILPQTATGWSVNGKTGVLDVAVRLTDSLVKEYNGDKNRIYVTGLSLGGFATWNILAEYPDYFAAAVPVCGGIYSRNRGSYLKNPIWTYHGDADNTVSFGSTQSTYNSIILAGGKKIKFIKLNGIGHNAWDYAYKDREMLSWLFSQELGTHQDLTYTYRNFFEIVSPHDKVLVTENDILEFYIDSDGVMNFKLNDEATERLKKQYLINPIAKFSVRMGSQKLYDFKICEFSKENIFKLEKTMDDYSYSIIYGVFNRNHYCKVNNQSVYTVYDQQYAD